MTYQVREPVFIIPQLLLLLLFLVDEDTFAVEHSIKTKILSALYVCVCRIQIKLNSWHVCSVYFISDILSVCVCTLERLTLFILNI